MKKYFFIFFLLFYYTNSVAEEKIFYLDGGKSDYGLESTVVQATNKKLKILRLGSITHEEIRKVISKTVINNNNSKISPGQQ